MSFLRGHFPPDCSRAFGLSTGLTLVAASGCASTAGGAGFESGRVEYERSALAARASAANDAGAGLHADALDEASFVRAVLARNPTVESARQGWKAALARVRQAGALEQPTIDLGIAPLSIGSNAPLGYELGISQRLPWFGKRALEASAASAEAAASNSDYEVTKRDLALSAVVLYDQYFLAVRSIEVNAHHVELMRVMRDAATAQFQVGRGAARDSLQAEGELAHTEHDTAILASRRDVTIAEMNELLHRAPELMLPPPPRDLPVPAIAAAHETERLETEALAQRSEIRAAQQRAEAAQARAERAERDKYPDLTVSTSYNSMWDTAEHRWMVGLALDLPIRTERRAGAADEAIAMRTQFESEASRMSDAARTQVFVAIKQLDESVHVLGLFERRLLPIARDQIDAASAGFIASQNPFLAVVEAEKNLRGVELDYQTARAECDRRRAELDRALGRIPGLEGKADQP